MRHSQDSFSEYAQDSPDKIGYKYSSLIKYGQKDHAERSSHEKD